MSEIATVKDHNPKCPPTLTPGSITPEVLLQWERSCKEYFWVKDVTEEKKVGSVLARLQDLSIADWLDTNEERLKALEFSAFMDQLRERALEKDWDRKIYMSILSSKQGERTFHEWAYELQTRNALLRGSPYHFNEKAFRDRLQINMDPSLELRARKLQEASLWRWIKEVELEDEFSRMEGERMRKTARGMNRKEQNGTSNFNGGRATETGTNNAAPTTQRPAASMSVLPKLTPTERAIIIDHQGCFKCRRIYVCHRAASCPNGVPQPGSYKRLTTAYAEAVRDSLPSAVLEASGESDSDFSR